MDTGIFANVFLVTFENESLNLVEQERSIYPSLKGLKSKFPNVYSDGDKVYGYGTDLSELKKIGFRETRRKISEIPKTTCRLILEGFCNKLRLHGYDVEWRGFITQAFDTKNPIATSIQEVKLLKGCEFRTVYLRDPLEDKLVFGLILDMKFKLICEGNPASYFEVRRFVSQKYSEMDSKDVIREIRVKTGDLTPSGSRNSEASKFRYEGIMEIVKRVGKELVLPDGSRAMLAREPVRVVIEVLQP